MKKTVTLLLTFIALYAWQLNAQITSFPYSEDFESGAMPTGWVKELPGGSGSNDITISTDENHTSGGQYSVRFSSYFSSSDYNQYLFTDTIHVTSPHMGMTFWVKKYDSDETLEWGICTGSQSSGDVSNWNNIPLTTSWEKVTVDLSPYAGQTIFFAWHYYANYQYYVYLDDVEIIVLPDCPDPQELSATPISPTDVNLDWETWDYVTQWEIEYDTTGFAQGTGTVLQVSSKPFLLTGLTPEQPYDFYVRSDCGNGTYSNWVGPYTWYQPHVNDYCSGAIDLPVNQSCSATLVDVTHAYDSGLGVPGNCGYFGGRDLWYKITAPADIDSLNVRVFPGNIYEESIEIFTGDCSNLNFVGCIDAFADDSITLRNVQMGDIYYVRVFPSMSDDPNDPDNIGTFYLCAYAPNLSAQTLTTADFNFYPNPTSNTISWNANGSVEKIQINNLTGQVLINLENPSTNSLDISRLPKGVYLLNVQMGDKQGTYRLIRE